MRVVPLLLVVSALAGCHKSRPHPAPPPERDEDLPLPLRDAGPPEPRPPARCTTEETRWRIPPSGPGAPSGAIEGGTLVHTPLGDWLAWIDRGASTLVVSPPSGDAIREPLGAGETEAPVLAPSGSGVVVVTVVQRAHTRVHRVLLARAGAMRELFTQAEAFDDSSSIAAAATAQGVLIAWDEDRPGPHGGIILGQFVPHASLVTGSPVATPASQPLTPDDLDAGDPVLIALPNGTAALSWLAAQDLDGDISNQQTAADIWLRALGADGPTTGASVKISPGPGNRFAVSGFARASALWVSYRVAGDADQESQGDGGSVAAVRLGADLHPSASPSYVTSEHAIPTGAPVLVGDGGGVTVFWTEREGDTVRTMRRPVEPDGQVSRPSVIEPALGGDLPSYGEGGEVVVLRHGPHGELGTARAHCPEIPASVVPRPRLAPAGPPRTP